jgi:hypothetical protein
MLKVATKLCAVFVGLIWGTLVFHIATANVSFAQDPEEMSCSELWYKRNEIYARNGYCFKTARARAVFGRGCFPPFGQMSGWEKRRVNELQYWEARKGC